MNLQETLLKMYQKHLVCKSNTEIVIEGYPRSGNSFTWEMLNVLSEGHGALRIAHHTHNIMNVRLGAQMGKPLLILLRKPEQAILSSMLFDSSSVEKSAIRYRDFYNEVLGMENVHIVPFEVVVSDFKSVFKLVLDLTGRQIPLPDSWENAIQKAKAGETERANRIHGDAYERRVAVPNVERDRLKNARQPEVEKYLSSTDIGKEIFDIYERCLARAVLSVPAS